MSFEVRDKVALVTGANRGIGKSITETLIQHGACKIYAAVRNTATAAPLVQSHGDVVVPIELDLTDHQTIVRAAKVANDVELVVNNAGVLSTETVLSDNAIDAVEFEFQTNVVGLIHIAQAFAPVLANNGGGALVQLNSMASIQSNPSFATYCATKAAAYSLTQSLRIQLADQRTFVLSVHPGPIATDMGDTAGLSEYAEPAELVGAAIVESLAAGEFHCFPDSMAKKLERHYRPFASRVIERKEQEG